MDDTRVLQLQRNKQYRDRALPLVLDGTRVSGTIEFNPYNCRSDDLEGMTVIPINVGVLISSGDNFLLVPLTADGRIYRKNN